MSDRFHFYISSSIVCSMIGLVFWSQIPSTSQLIPHRESHAAENSQATINSFLEIEEGEIATVFDPPSSSNRIKGKHKQYIPLNVVPEQTKNQSHQNRSGKSNLSTSNQRVVSQKLNRHLQQTETNANELIRQSSDSFGKGLMSLVDYNLALNIAYDTKIEAADIRQIKRAKVSLLTSKQKLLQQAVEQLQNFNQPAAQGWYGDVVHAKLLLSQNQY
ncbi:hypothetical protein, partial [uncultured Gimesia sp.]|uniref:hypothetical protein n=1 Tax=uncultured Gimesia sp. TaxID=1678688 RepID=UPI0026241EA3